MSERIRTILAFAGWFMFVFFVSFSVLYLAGAVPDEIRATADAPAVQVAKDAIGASDSAPSAVGEDPVRIKIPAIGLNDPVLNPSTANADVLDEALKSGAVRYPGSGTLAGGNMFLFGHSTGFKVVNNPAYKTFNNIKTLKPGDLITVYSKDNAYTYSVDSETESQASDILIEFNSKDRKLTLSTCNTFKEKEARSVVVAHFVSEAPYYPASPHPSTRQIAHRHPLQMPHTVDSKTLACS